MRQAVNLILRAFFYLLYGPLAWCYDAVAWLVSLGRWQSWVSAVLPYVNDGRVLELGHGPGYLQVAMRSQGLDAVGVDLSLRMGQLAVRRLQRDKHSAHLVCTDGRRLPFASASFDHLVATFPTEYITEPRTLSEARRLLAASGDLVLLPVAWITGGSLPERLAAALFAATGQAAPWDGRFSRAIRNAGFEVSEQRLSLTGSELMLLVCKPA